jgi:arylsulfatase A-like enzyme
VTAGYAATAKQPNILFIAVDDLNDWIGCMGGNDQSMTPNMDRLARSGLLFTNAHCAAPACNPSRTAIMTGLSPHMSGLYDNRQKMREILPSTELLSAFFSRHGYWSTGSGKILHYFIDAPSWDSYYPEKTQENPFPPHMPWGKRPKSLPVGGPWQYSETDWHAFDVSDEEFGGDVKVADYVCEQLARPHDTPFFLACGIYRPHEPWFNPKKYFDMFPLEDIKLPPGYRADDLDDLPPAGKSRGPNRYFKHIREQRQWRKGIQGYLASIAFADRNVGRVLDALDDGPHRNTTIVILWSDHGWHLGEKQHWQKYTPWRLSTRVPLMVRVPKGTPTLPGGTTPGSICTKPVNLVSLFPTLAELAGLPENSTHSGPSLLPLLRDHECDWPYVSHTFLADGMSVAISSEDHRYIHYGNGEEELYCIEDDPFEWSNVAGHPEYDAILKALRAHVPERFAPRVVARQYTKGISSPEWVPREQSACPSSEDGGRRRVVQIRNNRFSPVTVYWIDAAGTRAQTYAIQPGAVIPLHSFVEHAFLVCDPHDEAIGYFVVQEKSTVIDIPNTPIRVPDAQTQPSYRGITGVPDKLELDSFYKKMLNLDGYLICSSANVDDYALREAAYLISMMLAKRPDLHRALVDGGSRLTVMAADEFTTDVPEHRSIVDEGRKSSDWWDRRARGLGGDENQPVASCGEENLLCFEGDPYAKENILIHEFAHQLHLRGLNRLDPTFDDRLQRIWKAALAAGLWAGTYASTAHTEYFAEGVQSWFNNNRENDHDHNHVNTREELKQYDPALAQMLSLIFGETELAYVKPRDRLIQAHMDGYNYEEARAFRWPRRLEALDDEVKREAVERNQNVQENG